VIRSAEEEEKRCESTKMSGLAGLQVAASLPGVGDSGIVQGLLAKLARGAAARV
jgi:hypothetical protein